MTGKSLVDSTKPKDKLLTFSVDEDLDRLMKRAASQEHRPVANYLRHLVLADLQRKGLVDQNMTEITTEE